VTTIGAFEAKTHLSKLLERVEAGEEIVITRHGKEVARLVPPKNVTPAMSAKEAVMKWRALRIGIKLKGLRVRDLIEKGRR
jgi:prevent-host-death family protein